MNDYAFGNFVCMLRENKGLTQQNIADMLGVTPAAVSKWENGSSKPRVEVLFTLAKILDVRPEELMAGKFLTEKTIDAETAQYINERYEYLSKIEPHASARVKFKRLLSSIIDLSTTTVFAWLTTSIAEQLTTGADLNPGTKSIICVLCFAISQLLFLGLRDFVGFGKRIMRLIVLDKSTGKEAKTKQKLLRGFSTAVITSLSGISLIADVIVILVRGQSIGDSVAHTVVVEKGPCQEGQHPKACITEDDFQGIPVCTPSRDSSKKYIIGTVFVIVAAVIAVIGFVALYFIKFDSNEYVTTDIVKYEADCATYCNASAFMPNLETLTDYTELHYSHKTMVYSQFMGFVSDGLTLFVQYDASVYEAKKADLLQKTTFLDAPIIRDDVYILPVTEFVYKNYLIKIVPDARYTNSFSCKSFGLIGFDDENKSIVYCYYYDNDLDYIATIDESPEVEMCEFMDDVFAWKVDIVANTP